MRIILMGTGPFAVPSCQQLLEEGHEIPLVITRPPVKPTGKKIPEAPVVQWANQHHLPLFQPDSINAEPALERLRALAPDLFFVCDYGQILSKECLAIPRLGGINLHGSLLPRHRGAAPVQWTLLAGDNTAGVSVIHMTPGLDAGPVLSVEQVSIERDENAEQLESRLSQIGQRATRNAVALLANWDCQSTIGQLQDRALATKAPRLMRADGKLDFNMSASTLERRIRGMQPWPGTFADLVYADGKTISMHIRSARALPQQTPTAEPGTCWPVTALELHLDWVAPWDKLLAVQTSDGLLLVNSVQPAGKRPMPVADYLRGHPISGNARFVGSPPTIT